MLAIAVSVAMGLDRLHGDTVLFALLIFVGVGLVLYSYSDRGGTPPKSVPATSREAADDVAKERTDTESEALVGVSGGDTPEVGAIGDERSRS